MSAQGIMVGALKSVQTVQVLIYVVVTMDTLCLEMELLVKVR